MNKQENEDSSCSNNNKKFRSLTNLEDFSNSHNSKSKILKELNQSGIIIPTKKFQSKRNLDKQLLSNDNNFLSHLNIRNNFYNFNENIFSSTHLTKSINSVSLKSIEKDLQQRIFNISMKIEKESSIIGVLNDDNIKLTALIKKKIVDKDNVSIFSPKHNKKIQNCPEKIV